MAQWMLSVTDAISAGIGWMPSKPAGAFGDPTTFGGIATSQTAGVLGWSRFYRKDWENADANIGAFYDMKISASQLERSIKDAVQTGDIEWARRKLRENKAPLALRKMFDKVGRNISKINRQIRNVILQPKMTPSAKRNKLKRLREMKSKLAEQAARMGRKFGL